MSEHVEGLNRNQTALFPDTLEGYVDKDNPVRFIDAFIDSLNLEQLGFKHALPSEARAIVTMNPETDEELTEPYKPQRFIEPR